MDEEARMITARADAMLREAHAVINELVEALEGAEVELPQSHMTTRRQIRAALATAKAFQFQEKVR